MAADDERWVALNKATFLDILNAILLGQPNNAVAAVKVGCGGGVGGGRAQPGHQPSLSTASHHPSAALVSSAATLVQREDVMKKEESNGLTTCDVDVNGYHDNVVGNFSFRPQLDRQPAEQPDKGSSHHDDADDAVAVPCEMEEEERLVEAEVKATAVPSATGSWPLRSTPLIGSVSDSRPEVTNTVGNDVPDANWQKIVVWPHDRNEKPTAQITSSYDGLDVVDNSVRRRASFPVFHELQRRRRCPTLFSLDRKFPVTSVRAATSTTAGDQSVVSSSFCYDVTKWRKEIFDGGRSGTRASVMMENIGNLLPVSHGPSSTTIVPWRAVDKSLLSDVVDHLLRQDYHNSRSASDDDGGSHLFPVPADKLQFVRRPPGGDESGTGNDSVLRSLLQSDDETTIVNVAQPDLDERQRRERKRPRKHTLPVGDMKVTAGAGGSSSADGHVTSTVSDDDDDVDERLARQVADSSLGVVRRRSLKWKSTMLLRMRTYGDSDRKHAAGAMRTTAA